MRICIISQLDYGNGAAIAAFRLARSLAETGHEVYYVFKFSRPGGDGAKLLKRQLNQHEQAWLNKIALQSLKVLPLSFKFELRYLRSQTDAELRTLIQEINPDVINLHNVGKILKYESIERLGHEYPVVWTLHDLWAVCTYHYEFVNRASELITTSFWEGALDPKPKAVENLLNSSANVSFVSPSRWLYREAAKRVQQRKQITVIANGVPTDDFYPEDTAQVRAQLQLHREGYYILFLASILSLERKNIQVLLEAFELLGEGPIKVIALGKAPTDFKDRYPFIQFIEPTLDPNQLRKVYAAANVFLMTSLIDNLPNTVLESLYCGTPVIGANTGGIPEMVIPNQTGWLFDPYHPKALAEVILSTYEQKNHRLKLSSNCRRWVLEHFNLNYQRDRYLKLFSAIQA